MARRDRSGLFTTPRFLFYLENYVYVGSNPVDSGISLADIIDGTVPMRVEHASAILKQIIIALQMVHEKSVSYNSLKASRIFVARDGTVKLSCFGPHLQPTDLNTESTDCQSVGHLARHILTGILKVYGEAESLEQKMVVQTQAGQFAFDIDHNLDSSFFDFFQMCMDSGATLARLLRRCLIPLVQNAERAAYRPCSKIAKRAIVSPTP
ncbi:hypothetical protein B0O99DRAFT_594739 [Bisporella sp. PMI_857]|nr:hypothetical protein B0O99DRAFT_594739 [Bisporella sp. PMI_857]